MENAAWDAARVSLGEKRGDKKGDEGAGKDKDDTDFAGKGMRKGDDSDTEPGHKDFEGDEGKKPKKESKSKVKEQDDEEDAEEMQEGVEAHTCPLCESTLEEELSDEQIREHVAQIQAAIQSIEEGGDDDDGPASEQPDQEPTEDDLGPPDADEAKKKKKVNASKKESVMKKVKELKKASKGK